MDQATTEREAAGEGATTAPELSVVLPCLNEADTLATCIGKAQAVFEDQGIAGEIVVADNGSVDGSVEIAERMGARVVPIALRGYGHALMGGIQAARGTYVVMADADDSYDLLELPKFIEKLRAGYPLVQGCRLEAGGGRVMPDAMPFLHRHWGNPMFSRMARRWFHAPITDVYCGYRGFTKELWLRLRQQAGGMEFATEMIIRASIGRIPMAEVPITLHPDGRVSHGPHLRTFRDGLRTLRFFLMYSPRRMFLMPGALAIALGLVGYGLALPGVTIAGATLGPHTMLFGSLAILCGYQAITFAIFTKTLAIVDGHPPQDPRWVRFFALVNLRRALMMAGVALAGGIALLTLALLQWASVGFGRLDYADTMRLVIPGATLTTLAVQTVLSSFFVSILGMRSR